MNKINDVKIDFESEVAIALSACKAIDFLWELQENAQISANLQLAFADESFFSTGHPDVIIKTEPYERILSVRS